MSHSLHSIPRLLALSGPRRRPQDFTVRQYVPPIGTLNETHLLTFPPRARQVLLHPVRSSHLPLYVPHSLLLCFC